MALPLSAATAPYKTYTYDMSRETLISPDVYVPDRRVSNYEMGMTTPLSNPKDIFVDADNNIYISDTGNSRIVVCDSDLKYQYEISTFNNAQGVPDSLSEPEGVYVNEDHIFVCDTKNYRIVIFDRLGNFERIFNAPTADIMGEDVVFNPVAIAVSESGRIYVVSSSTYSGVFALDEDGNFQTFVGTQKVSVPLATRIRRMIFPNTVSISYISTEYNNIAIDDDGYIWVTSNSIEEADLTSAIESDNPDYAPVKRMNSAGDDITVRNGFFIPAGEINFMPTMKNAATEFVSGPSSLVDVAIGPNGMWSVLDQKRSRIYTYDAEGNLLFAFGDIGHQLGNLSQPTALTYFGADLYVLDTGITIYKRTEYGDVIDNALYYNRIRNYSSALENWQEILKRNNNFDAAYVGVGKNLYSQGHYAEAMEFFKTANDTENYSEAFKALRREWVGKYFLVVVAVIVVVLVLVIKGLSYVGKVNKAGDTKVGKRTFKEELLYAFYVMVHPFDGFWDLKHEKRGSVRAAIAVLVLAAASLAYKNVGSGYLYSATTSGKGTSVGSVFTGIASVAVPLLLWCLANWCLTTLFDGEGTLKDIFITSCYSLMPIPVLIIPTTIASNFLTLDAAESNFVTLLTGLALVWVGLLLFFGIMTTHGYSMGLNIGMTILTIVAMLFIVFLCMLFTNLITRMVSFITDIVLEISYRSY